MDWLNDYLAGVFTGFWAGLAVALAWAAMREDRRRKARDDARAILRVLAAESKPNDEGLKEKIA